MDAIIIEGLKVETVVGCFNWERQIIQPLMLDLIIQTDLEQASNSDALADTLNYAEICEISSKVIIAQANSVGIRLERHRNDFRPSISE